MQRVISASRRTDLVASFHEWLAVGIHRDHVKVAGPSGHTYTVDIDPIRVHTLVLWSKDFSNLIHNASSLLDEVQRYRQLYLHFTITGLGGTLLEKGVPDPSTAISQLDPLVSIAGNPERLSVRFDPIVFWKEGDTLRSNLDFFSSLAPELARRNIRRVRFSFAQWYRKALRRAQKYGLDHFDPPPAQKLALAGHLVEIAREFDLQLLACSQEYLSSVEGIRPSACIDGELLSSLHPDNAPAPIKKDRTQRKECLCTESIDVGSYTQSCPQSCLYCYANPSL
jgi:hypothetical protein